MTWDTVHTVDYHTEGEPFRIVPVTPIDFPGVTVAERRDRAEASDQANALREFLALEPRGFDGMYGGFIVPPNDEDAHIGVLFWHRDGFSRACGHGSMALAVWAVDHGLVAPGPSGDTEVVIDVPAGRIRVTVRIQDGHVQAAIYSGVPARVVELGRLVPTAHGELQIATIESGHNLLAINIERTSLQAALPDLTTLIELFRDLTLRSAQEHWPTGGAGIAVFYRRSGHTESVIQQRGVAIYGKGQVDRSPCGTGTAALTALLHLTGELRPGTRLVQESMFGSRFTGSISDKDAGPDRVIARVEGRAYPAGQHTFVRVPADPFPRGISLDS